MQQAEVMVAIVWEQFFSNSVMRYISDFVRCARCRARESGALHQWVRKRTTNYTGTVVAVVLAFIE